MVLRISRAWLHDFHTFLCCPLNFIEQSHPPSRKDIDRIPLPSMKRVDSATLNKPIVVEKNRGPRDVPRSDDTREPGPPPSMRGFDRIPRSIPSSDYEQGLRLALHLRDSIPTKHL
jgi:hypothetical protein